MLSFRTLLPAVLAAALLVPLLALPHTGAFALTSCDASHPVNDAEELAFLGTINAYRAENGLGPLTISENLNREAAWMAADMAANRYFGHYDSLGRHPWVRSVDCGYPIPAGENLAAGWKQGGAQAAFDLFKGSPTHNENMLGATYRQIGIARVWDESSVYGWYWATEFGTTDDGTTGAPAPAAPATAEPPLSLPDDAQVAAAPANPPVPGTPFACPASITALGDLGGGTVYQYLSGGEWRHYNASLPAYVNTFDPAQAESSSCWLVAP